MQAVTHPLINLTGFQICWWSCVLLPQGFSVTVIIIYLVAHLGLHPQRRQEMHTVILAGGLGIMIDKTLTWLGVLQFSSFPWWLGALWLALATTLNNGLSFFQNRYLLAASFGAMAGSLSYFAGHQFGVLQLGDALHQSLFIFAVVWALLFPTLLWIAQSSHQTQAKIGG